jgi:hypothetical protein
LVDLFDLVGETRYTSVLWPDYYRDTAQFPLSFLLSRFNGDNQIVDGVVYTTQTNTLSGVIDDTASIQGQPIVFASDRQIDGLFGASVGANSTKLADVRMAFLALAIDRSRVDGADVSDLVSGALGLADYTGGAELASLPYHNIAIPDTVPSNSKWYWSEPEQRILRENNISTWGVNRANNTEISGDMLTMWKTDAMGNPNTTWTSLEDLWTSSTVREYTDSSLRTYLAKIRMTNGDVIFDRSMANEQVVENKVMAIYRELGQMCLCTAGGTAEKAMKKTLSVNHTPSKKMVEISATFEIISQVGTVSFNLRITQQYK